MTTTATVARHSPRKHTIPLLSQRGRKLMVVLHVVSSVGWLGLSITNLALAVTGATTADPNVQRSVYTVMAISGEGVLLPMALTAFVTGVVLSLRTPWGLVRYYWVAVKLVLTLIAVVLTPTSLLPGINAIVDILARTEPGTMAPIALESRGLLFAASVSTAMYLACVVLSVFKPWGRTAHGRRTRFAVKS